MRLCNTANSCHSDICVYLYIYSFIGVYKYIYMYICLWMIHVRTSFFLSFWFFFLLLLFSMCNFAFFAIVRNARVKHMHVVIEREKGKKKKRFHSQKKSSADTETGKFGFWRKLSCLSMSFSPCNKIHNEISLLSILLPPSPLLTLFPRYLPSIEYFRVHWWLGAELLAFCQFFAPFTVGLRMGELPSRGWGSFRVQWSWNNARSGVFPPLPTPLVSPENYPNFSQSIFQRSESF